MSAINKLATNSFGGKVVLKMPKVKTDPGDSKKAAAKKKGEFVKAFQSSVFNVEKQVSYWLNEAMEESTWIWTRPTQRVNGSFIQPGPRNIVDTGTLRNSKKLKTSFGSTQAKMQVTYTAPYAGLVHWGGYITNYGDPSRGQTYIPGRPWVQKVFSTKSDADSGQSDRFGFLEEIKEQMLKQLV